MTTTKLMLIAGALLLAATPALAQQRPRCGPRADVLKQLSSTYREAPVAVGIGSNGRLLEVVASVDGATWTVLVTSTDGISCMMMSGETWELALPQTQHVMQSPDDMYH